MALPKFIFIVSFTFIVGLVEIYYARQLIQSEERAYRIAANIHMFIGGSAVIMAIFLIIRQFISPI